MGWPPDFDLPHDGVYSRSRKAEVKAEAEPIQDGGEASRDTSSESDTTARGPIADVEPPYDVAEFNAEVRYISRGMLARLVLDSHYTGGPQCWRGASSVNSKTRNTPRNPASVVAIAIVAAFLALLGFGVATKNPALDSATRVAVGTFHMR